MNINYIRSGDYFIPDLKLPEETRPIGKWGRMHREYLKEHHPIQYTNLVLSCKLWTYLADLNERAQERLDRIMQQMKEAESKHRHDFVTCKCGACSVDGGHDYLRRCFKEEGCYTDISICKPDSKKEE